MYLCSKSYYAFTKKHGSAMHVAFLDASKAFDRVNRRKLLLKEQIEDKTTSLLVQIDNRIRILVMLQIMMLNISSPVYVITKISAIISRYLTAKFEQ